MVETGYKVGATDATQFQDLNVNFLLFLVQFAVWTLKCVVVFTTITSISVTVKQN